MINTFEIYEELTNTVDEKTAKSLTRILSRIYEDIKNTPSKEDFSELKGIVKELSEAQQNTEQKLNSLTLKVEELAEAQKNTEQRLNSLTLKVEELAEAQKRTEIRINELTEAQKESEKRISRLEIAMEELVKAQMKTEDSLNKLIGRVDIIEDRLEGTSNSVGYSLENSAYKSLPRLLAPFGIKIKGNIIRKYVNGFQINIYSKAEKNGQDILLLGECKVRPSKKEIDRFIKISRKVKEFESVKEDIVLIFTAHDYPPDIENYLKEKNIIYFWSYEF